MTSATSFAACLCPGTSGHGQAHACRHMLKQVCIIHPPAVWTYAGKHVRACCPVQVFQKTKTLRSYMCHILSLLKLRLADSDPVRKKCCRHLSHCVRTEPRMCKFHLMGSCQRLAGIGLPSDRELVVAG